ncbi:MAG: mechanosensitive ion channel family protein [Thermodesulfobacteriota bacterium]|nr:mechanosensitive ion channel family protein [Thermodesulfobacteriota bacterium]
MEFSVLENLLVQKPFMTQIFMAVCVLIVSFISYFVTKRYLLKALSILTQKTKTKFDDILTEETVLKRLSHIVPVIIIYVFAHLFPSAEDFIRRISIALIAWLFILAFGAALSAFSDIYLTLSISKGRPIKGYIQISKLIIYIMGAIIIVCSLVGRSPVVLLSGFGAMTAIILLIFRDTILSLIASLQITANDLVRVGDWVEVPSLGADGNVMDIALHTVKIQNWDKTITVIPTHKLIDVTFKNWRGMQQSGGRRIKRAVYIDLGTIMFCDDHMIEHFKKISLIEDYVKSKEKEIAQYNKEHGFDTSSPVNGRRMTNIGTFRAYINAYLRNHKRIHQDMTFLVRQLPPGPTGLPMEIYVFTNDTAWANYEAIQADIFDHILAVVPQFQLRVFQTPTGEDLGKLKGLS